MRRIGRRTLPRVNNAVVLIHVNDGADSHTLVLIIIYDDHVVLLVLLQLGLTETDLSQHHPTRLHH